MANNITARQFGFELYRALDESETWGPISPYDLLAPDPHECNTTHPEYPGECSDCYDHVMLMKAIDKVLQKVV